MKKGRIVIISGPSGSGKTTLHKMLLESPRFRGRLVKSLSATTRARRPGERHGRDYLFLTEKEFLRKIKAGQFLEFQKVFDRYYGTPRKAVMDLLRRGKHVLLCIDVKGARVVWEQYPQALRIFVKTPSLTELKRRLKSRGTENPKDLKIRLQTAREELRETRHYDRVVVNDRLAAAYKRLENIVCRELSPLG
ncbi:MAG: guanylate kinase [Candidatus Omnitrophota bacterium]|nr:guanylate kinase [Candidatus Omnitrophota bacterium]MDZ4243193.1 guanylate kinase [Candidatus Omnitrophota bacterium]